MSSENPHSSKIKELEELLKGLEIKERTIQEEIRAARQLVTELQAETHIPTNRVFRVGDIVQILNPKEGQLREGRIQSFTPTGLARITGRAPSGEIDTIRRSTNKISHIHHE